MSIYIWSELGALVEVIVVRRKRILDRVIEFCFINMAKASVYSSHLDQ